MPRTVNRRAKVAAAPFPRGARFLSAALLVGFGSLAIAGGAASMPWLANLAEAIGFPRGHGPRLLAGVLFALGGMIVLAPSWSRRLALIGPGVLVFAGTATASTIRATRMPGPDGPGLGGWAALAVAGAALAAVAVGALIAMRALRSSAPPSRGLSVAWRIAASFVALGGGLAIAAPSSSARPRPVPAASGTVPVPAVVAEAESIDLDIAAWAGRPLADTPAAVHLPTLPAIVGSDPVYLVLYNTRCGTCHELFRERFAGGLPRRVIAIEIPPAADAVLAAGDGESAIECPDCERMTLPSGPRWLVRPPTVVRVDDGVVTCVDDASGGGCFDVTP